jgi:RNA polymerase sigma factor (sigma-70 family)
LLRVTKAAEIDALVERWQRHRDQRAFDRLLETHRVLIYRAAYQDPDLVPIGNAGFLRAVNKATVGNRKATFATYCRKFVRDAVIDALRQAGRWDRDHEGGPTDRPGIYDPDGDPLPDDDVADARPLPDDVALDRIDNERLVSRLMARLDSRQRFVVQALVVEDRTEADVAEELGCDARHVRRLLKKALDVMRADR